MLRPLTAEYTELLEDDDEVMTVQEYLDTVRGGGFIDYDGFGLAVKDGKSTALGPSYGIIKPSDKDDKIPFDATHIVWYNR